MSRTARAARSGGIAALLLLAGSLVACLQEVKPVAIRVPKAEEAPADIAVRTLAAEGLTAVRNDPAGVVETAWVNTGFRYGKGPRGGDAFLVRRFTLTLRTLPDGGTEITIRTDLMKCELPGVVLGAVEIHAGCERLKGGREADQKAVERLAEALAGSFPAR